MVVAEFIKLFSSPLIKNITLTYAIDANDNLI